MAHLERDGFSITIHGPAGSYRFPRDFGPGDIMAGPYSGPGGTYSFEVELYEDGARLLFVTICTSTEFGESRDVTVYQSFDGGKDFREQRDETGQWGTRVAHIDLKPPP